jgi:hypothetical protein
VAATDVGLPTKSFTAFIDPTGLMTIKGHLKWAARPEFQKLVIANNFFLHHNIPT